VIGWILGLAGGRFLTAYLASLTSLTLPDFSLSSREIVPALLVGAGVTVGATALPAWIAVQQRAARLLANLGMVADFQRGFTKRLTDHAGRAGSIAALCLHNIARRPTRAWATLAVVAVAVAAFLGTQAVSRSVSVSVDRVYGLYEAQGWISFAKPVDASFARVLDQHPDVEVAEPWDIFEASIGSVRTQILGVPDATQLYRPRLTAGTWLGQDNPPTAVLTTNIARKLKAQIGEIIRLDTSGKSMLVQVAGIVNDESIYLGGSTIGKIFLGVHDAERLAGQGSKVSLFALKLHSSAPGDVDRSLARLEHRFQSLHPVTLSTYMDQESSRRAISILTVMLDAMVLIIGIVGLAGIANTLLINLAERRREFGVLRALGATSRHMIRLVMTEALGLALVGCAIGVLVGYPLAHYLVQVTGEQLFKLEFHLGPMTVLSTLFVALAAAAVSTGPGLIATRIKPIQVLRYE
jgi:putative ABC transport system permease protein